MGEGDGAGKGGGGGGRASHQSLRMEELEVWGLGMRDISSLWMARLFYLCVVTGAHIVQQTRGIGVGEPT